jgi:hypothetical protein
MPAPELVGSILVAIGVLLAIVEGTPSAWFSVLMALCDFSQVVFEYMKEENVMKKVLVMVGNGVFGVT